MAIDRTNFNALVDDDGSNTTGTLWTKNQVKIVLLDPIDAAIIAPGGQIAFPATQVPSANANTLDDYEEFTWTPVIGGAGGTSGQTYANQIGNYIKIGKQVTVWFRAQLTAKGTITGGVEIQGIPFTTMTIANVIFSVQIGFHNLATNWAGINARIGSATTTFPLYGNAAAATSDQITQLATADISNTTEFMGVITYIASA
jgi:hypothetical protein